MNQQRTVAELKNLYKKILDDRKPKGQTFHDAMFIDRRNNPLDYDNWNHAVTMGRDEAKTLIAAFRNPSDPKHTHAKAQYASANYDPEALEKNLTASYRKLLGAKELETKDTSKEKRFLEPYRKGVITMDDQSVFHHFENFMKTKWAACGYNITPGHCDDEIAGTFWSENPMPSSFAEKPASETKINPMANYMNKKWEKFKSDDPYQI